MNLVVGWGFAGGGASLLAVLEWAQPTFVLVALLVTGATQHGASESGCWNNISEFSLWLNLPLTL